MLSREVNQPAVCSSMLHHAEYTTLAGGSGSGVGISFWPQNNAEMQTGSSSGESSGNKRSKEKKKKEWGAKMIQERFENLPQQLLEEPGSKIT